MWSLSFPQLFLLLNDLFLSNLKYILSDVRGNYSFQVTWFLQLVHNFPFGKKNLYLIVPQWIFDAYVPLRNHCGCFENLWLHISAIPLCWGIKVCKRYSRKDDSWKNHRKKKMDLSHFEVGFPCCWAPELDVAESVYFWNGHLLILCNAFFYMPFVFVPTEQPWKKPPEQSFQCHESPRWNIFIAV